MNNIPKPLYEVKFIDNFGHWYQIVGETDLYPSVTSVLKYTGSPSKLEALMGWAKKISLNFVSEELLKNYHHEKVEDNNEYILCSCGYKILKIAPDGNGFFDRENDWNEHRHVVIDKEDIDKLVKIGKQKPKFELEKAGNLGTRVHNAIDYYIIYNKMPEMDEDVKVAFNNFLEWMKTHKLTIVQGDTSLASKKYKFGGRCDCIAVNEQGEYIILDWKTSNSIQNFEYCMQVSSYAYCFSEQYNVNLPKKCYIIRFDKTNLNHEVVEVNNVQECFDTFLAVMKIKHSIENFEKEKSRKKQYELVI